MNSTASVIVAQIAVKAKAVVVDQPQNKITTLQLTGQKAQLTVPQHRTQ